jgi:hypothetical protein
VNVERQGRFMVYSLAPDVHAARDDTKLDLGCCSLEIAADQKAKRKS